MLTQASRLVVVFFTMLLAFAQIGAQELPKGIMMPEKRALVGTGGGGGSPSSNPPPTSTPSTNNNKQTSNNNPPPASSSPPPVGGGGGGGNSDPPPSSSPDNNNRPPPPSSTQVVHSTTIPKIVKVTTTNGDGKKVTTSISTNKVAKTTDKVKNSFVTAKGDKTINAATLTKQTVVSEALLGSKTIEKTYTSYYTSDGKRYSTVITTDVVVPTTTGYAKTTIAPSLANGGGSGSSLSSGTKAVIGGVVGGIGGAAMVGGIAFVLWRLWNKKKQEDQYDTFSDKYGSSNRESNMTFGSEGYGSAYSGGGGRVNPASNF